MCDHSGCAYVCLFLLNFIHVIFMAATGLILTSTVFGNILFLYICLICLFVYCIYIYFSMVVLFIMYM